MMRQNRLVLLLLLGIVVCGCLDPPVLVQVSGSSGSSNQVKVDGNDSTANYLFPKLTAGSNISLTILNPGANETVSIAAVSGSGGRTYTSGTPATIQVNNDLNTISQNFDGNFSSRFGSSFDGNFYSKLNALLPWQDSNVSDDLRINTSKDANFNNIKFNGVLTGGDFNYSLGDANGTQSCPAGQALQVIGSTVTCIAVGGSGSGRTYTSGTPATIEVNNDLNTISQNFDGNFWSRFTPANDGNFYTRFNASIDGNIWSRVAPLFPVPDANIANSSLYKANCDNNVSCTFTGRINTAIDSNFDANVAISTTSVTAFTVRRVNAGQLIFAVDTLNDSVSIGTFRGRSDATYDVGTAAIRFRDFFFSRNGRIDNNLFVGNGLRVANDFNVLGLSKLQKLNVDDLNASIADLNDGQSCPAGQALQSVGNTTSCVATGGGDLNWVALNTVIPWQDVNIFNSVRYKQDASCDSNLLCTTTNKITTTADANFNNIKFTGTLSGGDLNFGLGDANGTQTCSTGSVLKTVGSTTTCVLLNSGDLNWNALNRVLPWQDVNVADDITASNYVLKAGDTMGGALVLEGSGIAPSLQVTDGSGGTSIFQVNTDGTGVQSLDILPYTDNASSLGSASLQWRQLYAGQIFTSNMTLNSVETNFLQVNTLASIYADTNITKTLKVDGNFYHSTLDSNNMTVALDTCYRNSGERDMVIYGSATFTVAALNDSAYITVQTGGTCTSLTTKQKIGFNVASVLSATTSHSFNVLVPDHNSFKLVSAVAGTGTATLNFFQRYYP